MSHHPPAAAHHVMSQRGWTLWQEITIASKFRGKYLSIMPLGEWQPCQSVVRGHSTLSAMPACSQGSLYPLSCQPVVKALSTLSLCSQGSLYTLSL